MLWSKNREGKKAGTTLIGICWNGEAALGTDFDDKRVVEDEISVIENFCGRLVGYTGPSRFRNGLDLAKNALKNGSDTAETANFTASAWTIETEKAVDAFVVLLDEQCSFVVVPGKAETPKANLIAVGPGEEYALAAIRAILSQPVVHENSHDMVKKAFDVASGVCVLVNSGAKIVKLEK